MSKIHLYVLVSLLIASAASSEEKLRFNDVVDATIVILSQCLPPHAEETLLLAGEYNEFLRRTLFDITPVALIAESKRSSLEKFALTRYSYKMYQNYRFIHFLRKVHRFVMVTSSQPMLRSVLQRTKDSPWANADGFYILIDNQTDKRGCINARSYLWAAWEYDLLSVIFLCIDPDDGIVYYTYNPYTNETPSSWHEVDRLKGRNGHPWIMFKRKFKHDSELCKDLNFDKTTTLNGYVIRLNAIEMQPFLKINLDEEGLNKFSGEDSEVIKILFHKLKASLNIYIRNDTIYALGGIGSNGALEGMLTAIGDGKIDMSMNMRPLFVLWKLRYTYPHTRSALCVMTRTDEEVSEFTKLITFLTPSVKVVLLIVCLLTYAILTRKEGYARAALEVLRLLVCVAILHPPKINSARIFICMVLILFLNVNTLFQSHWSSLLTLPVYYGGIDNFDQLRQAGHNIYGSMALRDLFYDPVLQSRYNVVAYEACNQLVKNSTNAVCAGDCYHVYYRIRGDGDLYMSKPLRDTTQTFVTREDWPLYRRVNNAIQQMVQSGLIKKFRKDSIVPLIHQWEVLQSKKQGFKVMLLPQLAFSFYILGIGYTCASVIFVVELMADRTSRRRNRNANEKSEGDRREAGTDGRGKVATVLAWN